MEPGHCVICEIVGQGRQNFVCDHCGHPEKNTLYCAGCETRMEATSEIIAVIREFTGIDVPNRTGISIRLSSCAACGPFDANTRVDVHLLRQQHLH